MHATRAKSRARTYAFTRVYTSRVRAGSARPVVAATRMLDARPPGESMEHPLTTHSPSVSAYLPRGLPIGILFSPPSRSFPSLRSFRFLYYPFRPSSFLCFYPSACQSLSFSFVLFFVPLFLVYRLLLRPHPKTLRRGFFSFRRNSAPPPLLFLSLSISLLENFIHLSSPVLSVRDSCALPARPFLRVISATYRSLSVATGSLVSLL